MLPVLLSSNSAAEERDDAPALHVVQTIEGDALPSVRGLAISPDGTLAALYGEHSEGAGLRSLQLWDLPAGRLIRSLSGNKRPLRAARFSPSGALLACVALDRPSGSGDACVWRVATGERLLRLGGGGEDVRFVPDESSLEIASVDQIRRYRIESGDESGRTRAVKRGIKFAREGRRLLVMAPRREPRVWLLDVQTGRELVALQTGRTEPLAVAVSPDGRTIATDSGDDGRIGLWEVATGQLVCYLRGHDKHACALAFSPDGRYLASGSFDRTLRLWDVMDGHERGRGDAHEGAVTAVAFSPAGNRLVSAGTDRRMIIWDLPRRDRVQEPPLDEAACETLWRELASSRTRAYRAVGQLQQHSAQLLPGLLRRLETMLLPTDSGRIAQLLAELNDPNHVIREQAMQQLRVLRPSDAAALAAALRQTASNEVRARLKRVLREDGLPRISPSDVRRVERIVHALEGLPGSEARPILQLLIAHFPEQSVALDARETLERTLRRDSLN